MLSTAYEGVSMELMPLNEMPTAQIEQWMSEKLETFMGLTMGRYSAEARQEWLDSLVVSCADMPYFVLDRAMEGAIKEVSYPEKVVPFLAERVDSIAKHLTRERDILKGLIDLHNG